MRGVGFSKYQVWVQGGWGLVGHGIQARGRGLPGEPAKQQWVKHEECWPPSWPPGCPLSISYVTSHSIRVGRSVQMLGHSLGTLPFTQLSTIYSAQCMGLL